MFITVHVNWKILQKFKTKACKNKMCSSIPMSTTQHSNQCKISYDQSDISLSYLDIVCCGIPANCLRSRPGHNYALHWTRSSRCRLSPRLCYWGCRQSCPRGLGQLQPSMARRKKKVHALKVPFFNNSLCTVFNMTYTVKVDKIFNKYVFYFPSIFL